MMPLPLADALPFAVTISGWILTITSGVMVIGLSFFARALTTLISEVRVLQSQMLDVKEDIRDLKQTPGRDRANDTSRNNAE